MDSIAMVRWRKLGPYVDRLVELGDEDFSRLCEELQAQDPDLAQELRRARASYQSLCAENFLDTGSPIVPDPLLLTGKTIGAYTLETSLGHGGMSHVWLARRSDGCFEGKVAIKLLNAILVGRDEGRFRNEGHLLARLEHPNIARLLDAGVSDTGQPFLVLEYVRGRRIDEYCDDCRLDINARLKLFLDVLAATAHAHGQLVIHRDLKPANILVTAGGVVKLLDFGIAKLIHASDAARQPTTRVGQSPLTLNYASPEQIGGAVLGTTSDVYTLGVLLYELLTGTRPYRLTRESPGAIEEAILSASLVPPSRATSSEEAVWNRRATTRKKLAKALRNNLDAIVLTALKKEPSERYATAAAFAEDLKRYLRDEPIVARGDNPWHRTEKFIARNKLPVAAAATVVAALVVGLWMSLWQAHLARENAKRAEETRRFIESVFQQADPIVSGSADVRAVDLLLRGRERVVQELRGREAVQIELMCIIASSLSGLNAYTESLGTFERAMALGERSHADLAKTMPSCLIEYADLLSITGDYARSDAMLKTLEREPRDRSMDLMAGRTRQIRAVLDLEFGRTAEALEGMREAVGIIRGVASPGSRVRLDAMLNLARVQFHADQNAAALATVDSALEEFAANPREAQRAQGLMLLLRAQRARALSAIGRRDEAAQQYASLLPVFGATFGKNTQRYAVNVYEYSVVERRRGELKNAILLGEEALAVAKSSGSSESHQAIVTGGLATTLLLARRFGAARTQALEAQRLFGKVFGLDNPDGLRFQATAAYASGLTEQPLEAISKLERIVESQRADSSPYIGGTLRFLGELYRRGGQLQEAAVALREAEAEALGSADQSTLLPVIRAELGLALLGLGEHDAAAHKFQAAISGEGVPQTLTPAQADAHLGLARLFLERKDPASALLHIAKAGDFWRGFDPANSGSREAARWRAQAQRAAARGR